MVPLHELSGHRYRLHTDKTGPRLQMDIVGCVGPFPPGARPMGDLANFISRGFLGEPPTRRLRNESSCLVSHENLIKYMEAAARGVPASRE